MTLEFSCIVGSRWNQWNITRGAICLQILVGLGTSGKENRRKEEKKNRGKKKKKKKEKRETLGKANWCLHVWWGLSLQSLYPIGAPVQNKLSICSV